MDIEVSPKVTSVTVYSRQARVAAEGRVTLPAGAHRLVIGDLPLTMDTNSLRAGGKGSADVRLLSVDVKRQHYAETPAEQVRAVEERIERLEDDLQAAADEQAILDAQGRYLEGLRGASEQYARGLALGRTKVEEQDQISRFFREQDRGLRASRREIDKQKRKLSRDLDKARRELEELKSARPPERYQASVELEVLAEGEFDAEITYNVRQAARTPLYDVRLVETESGHDLEIEGIAQVTQSSGQDWLDVDLKVSTSQTELSRRVPELKPWYVDVYTPPTPRISRARAQKSGPAPQAMLMDAAASVEADEPVAAQAALAEVSTEESGAAVTYNVAGRGNVPSDGSPHKSTLFRSRLPSRVDYISVPKHTDAVYRRTKGNNDGPGPLLAGPVHLFVGQRFIGVSRLEYVAVGDEVELLLGVEERVTVKRELIRREVDKTRLRDKRQIQYGYETTIKNLLSRAVDVELHDHAPVARHEEITVKLLSSSPDPTERSELNMMEWHFSLPAGATEKVRYEYQVEHPRSLQVSGLVD
jgi:uncharacterized protein (TIGR02231 family)